MPEGFAASLTFQYWDLQMALVNDLITSDPNSARNRRIAITLLRQAGVPPKVSNVPHKATQTSSPSQGPARDIVPAPVNIFPVPPRVVPVTPAKP